MKKINLIVLVAFYLLCGVVYAASPNYFSCDFSGIGFNSLPEGWQTYGSGNIPAKSMQSFFHSDGSGPYYIPMIAEDGTSHRAAFSNSSFTPSAQADEWLVSPQIEIPSDVFVVGFSVYANGSNEVSKYDVYISDGGDAKADFGTTPVHSGTITGSVSDIIAKKDAFSLSGYKGKKIRLAFVNRNTDCAFLGFSDIQVGQYIIAVTNNTPTLVNTKDPITVSLTADILMPTDVNGFKAVFKSDNGATSIYDTDRVIGAAMTQISFDFPDKLDVYRIGDAINYTVTITPNFVDAEPTVIDGSVTCRLTYPSVCVVEELTGTWCSNCPQGIAALNRFHDEYPDRCYTIAVHGGEQDPMHGVKGFYQNNLVNVIGEASYPYAVFNRKVKEGSKIANMSLVENQLKNNSDYLAEMLEVLYDKNESEAVTATFNVRIGHSEKNKKLGVCVVVVEDNVKGTYNAYNQENGYYRYTKASVDKEFGEEWWPYFEPFCEKTPQIPYSQMVYNHVARGIFNNFWGVTEVLSPEWKGDVPQTVRVKFNMPDAVNDWNNTSMIAFVIDENGNIVAASRMKAEDYVKVSTMPEVLVTAIAIEPESTNLNLGESLNLSLNIQPTDASNKNVVWSSSDNSVATVSNGLVKALSVGTTIITATTTDDTKLSASCEVKVSGIDVISITVDPATKTIETGNSFMVNAVVLPENASVKEIKWTSDHPEIASVTQSGLVSALKVGTAIITASATDGSGVSAKCDVEVVPESSYIEDVDACVFDVRVNDGEIVIEGLKDGDRYSVLSSDGIVVRTGECQGSSIAIEVISGVYFITTVNGTVKVIVK